jgi:zinc transporter ZupT
MVSNIVGSPHHDMHDLDLTVTAKEAGHVEETGRLSVTSKVGDKPVDYSLVYNVVIGDGFHNLTDGILIGIAFMACQGDGLGWIVTAAILAHEVPQELVDFVVLVRAGLSVKMALLANFGSSLMGFIGVILVLTLQDSLSLTSQAYLLCYGSGFLAYIALAGLVPSIVAIDSGKRKALRLGLVIFGCVVIGLLKFLHPHCEAGGGHDGHGH